MVGHVAPDAAVGGPIAAVCEDDSISIDIEQQKITLDIPVDVLRERLSKFERPVPKYTTGVMANYVALVGSASEGAVTSQPAL